MVPVSGAGMTPRTRTSYCVPRSGISPGTAPMKSPTDTTWASVTRNRPGRRIPPQPPAPAATRTPPACAKTCADPMARAESFPAASTAIWAGADDVQVTGTVTGSPAWSRTVAVSARV